MATFKPVVFSTSNHAKIDGTTNIKIRVYHNKVSQYIPTDYYISPKFMLPDGTIDTTYPDSDLLNYELTGIVQEYRKSTIKLGSARTSNMTCMELKTFLTKANSPEYDFIDFVKFCEDIIEEEEKHKTAEWYRQSLDSFLWFYGKRKVDARDITRNVISSWIARLKIGGSSGKPLENGSINNYVRGLRALYNECKSKYNEPDYDIIRIPNEPFSIEIPKYRKKRKNVSLAAIKKIRDHEPIKKRPQFARDIFMMMFYLMGINIGDLYRLDAPRFGRVEYERSKTDTDDNGSYALSIKVEPELQLLFDKYSVSGFLSHIKTSYKNEYYFMKGVNMGLKEICEDLNIPKVTTNWARHSWASIARNMAKIPKADVDFCLGHVNNDYKMADIYIDIDYGIYDEANRKVLDLLL